LLKDNPATQLAWKIRDIYRLHMQNITEVSEKYGLYTGQSRILHTIANMNGATQKELADKLKTSPASLATSIKRMKKAGIVEKVADESDLRINLIYLTKKGEKVYSDTLINFTMLDNCLLNGFSAEEISQLDSFLTRVYTNLKEVKSLNA